MLPRRCADRRRRLHDAGHPRACGSGFPTHISPISSNRRRADRRATIPHLNEVIVAPRAARPGAACSTTSRSAGGCAPTRYDLAIDFHGGPRASLLTWLSGAPDAHRLRRRRRAAGCTRGASRGRASCAPRHSVENQWDLLAPLGIAPPDRARVPDGDAGRRATRRRASARGWRQRRRRRRTIELDRHARQRRQPVPALAGRRISSTLVARSLPAIHAAAIIVTSGPSERDAAARVIAEARARARRGRGRAACSSCGEFSLAELRALLDRAALYIGGDSGPLHIAATSTRADRRALRTDAAGPLGAVARAAVDRPKSVDAGGCRAGRAISASARRAISAA